MGPSSAHISSAWAAEEGSLPSTPTGEARGRERSGPLGQNAIPVPLLPREGPPPAPAPVPGRSSLQAVDRWAASRATGHLPLQKIEARSEDSGISPWVSNLTVVTEKGIFRAPRGNMGFLIPRDGISSHFNAD